MSFFNTAVVVGITVALVVSMFSFFLIWKQHEGSPKEEADAAAVLTEAARNLIKPQQEQIERQGRRLNDLALKIGATERKVDILDHLLRLSVRHSTSLEHQLLAMNVSPAPMPSELNEWLRNPKAYMHKNYDIDMVGETD